MLGTGSSTMTGRVPFSGVGRPGDRCLPVSSQSPQSRSRPAHRFRPQTSQTSLITLPLLPSAHTMKLSGVQTPRRKIGSDSVPPLPPGGRSDHPRPFQARPPTTGQCQTVGLHGSPCLWVQPETSHRSSPYLLTLLARSCAATKALYRVRACAPPVAQYSCKAGKCSHHSHQAHSHLDAFDFLSKGATAGGGDGRLWRVGAAASKEGARENDQAAISKQKGSDQEAGSKQKGSKSMTAGTTQLTTCTRW